MKIYTFQEGKLVVAYAPALDVASCGASVDSGRRNLRDAIHGFLEVAKEKGVIDDALDVSVSLRVSAVPSCAKPHSLVIGLP